MLDARTYVAVYDGRPHSGRWVHFRKLVNQLADDGHKLYVVLPSLYDGLLHRNIFLVVLESETDGWLGLRRMWWALRASRAARRLVARLHNAEYVAADTLKTRDSLNADAWPHRRGTLERSS